MRIGKLVGRILRGVRTAILILGALVLIGAMTSCDNDSSDVASFDAGRMVTSYYKAIDDGDTAKAQSYIAAGEQYLLDCTEDLVSLMAGKIQKVEVLDAIRAEGAGGVPPNILVYVRITCDAGVPATVRSCPYGGTCGDRQIGMYKFDSGWKITRIG